VRVASAASDLKSTEISVTPFSETGEVSTLEVSESPSADGPSDADLEEMSSELLESLPPAAATSWSTRPEADEPDEPPVSSQRPRMPSGLEASLNEGEAGLGEDREAPLITPPPESGPQEAPIGLFAPAVPDVDNLLGESVPPGPAAGPGPTPEQIGESVELEEPAGPALELDEARARPETIPPKEELEALLGQQPSAGIYDEGLLPPPQARDDLQAHDRRQSPSGVQAAAERPAFSSEPATQALTPGTVAEGTSSPPEVYVASLPSGGAPEIRSSSPTFRPQSFLELLDASLALAG
jgi:hypothetical protein